MNFVATGRPRSPINIEAGEPRGLPFRHPLEAPGAALPLGWNRGCSPGKGGEKGGISPGKYGDLAGDFRVAKATGFHARFSWSFFRQGV